MVMSLKKYMKIIYENNMFKKLHCKMTYFGNYLNEKFGLHT